ncbi:MAG: hypothetical protein DRH30_13030 [Deltaproteobacteria bacterium]|nr:MAG: hypothetical protein DRH30_13030 [Deltaproteobacteria bacterium]
MFRSSGFGSFPLLVALCVLVGTVGLVGCADDESGTAGTGGSAGAGGAGGSGGSPPLDDTFKAAACVRDITPISPSLASAYEDAFEGSAVVNHTDPIYMAGFGNDRQATGYHDRLWARGVVVAGPGGRVAIVSIDVVGYSVNETETIRAMVSAESGIDYAAISSTHVHEGPDTQGLWGPSSVVSGIDFGYLDFLNATVADCIDEAAANLEPARMRAVTPSSEGLSLGLDVQDDGFGVDDSKVLAGDAELAPEFDGRIVNSRLATMQFTKVEPREDGSYEVLATLVNFASHPESMGSDNTLLTSDFPHAARVRLEEEYGGTAIWVSADLGVLQGPLHIDVEDPDTGEPAERRTFRFADVHGAQLADRVISAIDVNEAADGAPEISFGNTAPVAIPLENPFFRLAVAAGVINSRRSLYTDGEPDASNGNPYPPPFDWIPQALGEDLHTEVGAIRIGGASIAVVPTELDPQLGENYRNRMTGAEHTFIVGLGNDHIGYQVPFDKWDGSCHTCFPYLLTDDEDSCPIQPIDCNTVFENNVGQGVDPRVSEPLLELIDALH